MPPTLPGRSRAARSTALALGAAAALTALQSGCVPGYYPGGSLASRDLYTYPSTHNWPQTVTLVDIRTQEVLWVVEIPVDQQLVVRFYEDEGTGNPDRPAMMRWELMPLGDHFGPLDNAMPVPSREARRLDTFLRKSPAVSERPPSADFPDTHPDAAIAPPPAPPAAAPAPEAPPSAEPEAEIDLPGGPE